MMRGFIYAYLHLIPGVNLRLSTKIAGISALAVAGISGFAAKAAAQDVPGLGQIQDYFDPDIAKLEGMVRDAVDHIMADPNIYASFDYMAMIDYLQGTTVGTYLLLALGAVYGVGLLFVVFRSRKRDP